MNRVDENWCAPKYSRLWLSRNRQVHHSKPVLCRHGLRNSHSEWKTRNLQNLQNTPHLPLSIIFVSDSQNVIVVFSRHSHAMGSVDDLRASMWAWTVPKRTPNPVNYQYKVLPLYLPARQGHEGSFSHSFTNVKERRWTEAIHIALSYSIPSHHVRRPWVTSYHQMYSNVNFWSLVILFRLPASRQVCRFRYCAKADGSLSWCDRSPASTRRL